MNKKTKFSQMNNNGFSLQDYYLALKFRNSDKKHENLANGIVHKIESTRKSSGYAGLLRSILRECVDVDVKWTNNKAELTVKAIHIPNELKPAFLPKVKAKKENLGSNVSSNSNKNNNYEKTK